MLLSTLSSRTNRAYVLAAIGIVTVLSILISFHTTLNVGISTYTYDSSRKELIKAQDTGARDGSNPTFGSGVPTNKSYRKTTCRSSTWGPVWTVDSNGGVCKHGEIGKNGCCLLQAAVPEVRRLNLRPLSTDLQRSPLSVEGEEAPKEVEEEDTVVRTGKHGNLVENNPNFESSPVTEEEPLTTADEKEIQGAKEHVEEQAVQKDVQKEEGADLKENVKSESSSVPPATEATGFGVKDVQFGDTLVRPTCSIEHQCCAQYEFCVSSCLDFSWQRLQNTAANSRADTAAGAVLQLIERLVGEHQAEDDNVAKEYTAGTTDLFDWCLLRCRTSGRSVVHQNSFRSSLKHCYGLKDPPLLARMIEKGETE